MFEVFRGVFEVTFERGVVNLFNLFIAKFY